MEDEIIRKLKDNIEVDLNIEELKKLYEIDSTPKKYLGSLRNKRNQYKDLCKIFKSNLVARSIHEINENTKVYIGDLQLLDQSDNYINPYNLKYIYGSLETSINLPNKLENLERVFGIIYLTDTNTNIKYIDWLGNVENSYVFLIDDEDDLDKYSGFLRVSDGYCYPLNEGDFKDDNLMAELIKINPLLLQYASDNIQNDEDIVYMAVSSYAFDTDRRIFNGVSPQLLSDKEFIKKLVKLNASYYQFASTELKQDKKYALELLSINSDVVLYLSDELKQDNKFISLIEKYNNKIKVRR